MKHFFGNIEKLTLENDFFRKVLFTGSRVQLTVMALKPGEDIGMETHPSTDQFIRIESGSATVTINGESFSAGADDVVIIPAGAEHDVVNTSQDQPLKLYSLYAPPEHSPEAIHPTKADVPAHHE